MKRWKDVRVLRHDGMIVANEVRSALSSWSDRLIALAVLSIALGALRSALSDRPFIFAATAVAAGAAAAGGATARSIERRLDLHAEEGVLAAQALAKPARRHYALSIHAIICAILTICAAVGRPTTALLAPIGYVVGASVCCLVCRFIPADASPLRLSPARAIRSRLHKPVAGAVAAIPVILALLLARSVEPAPMAAFVGVLSAVAALLLTALDDKIVRFMAQSGYSPARIVGIHARSLLVFLLLNGIASLVLSERPVAIVIVGIALMALMLMTARILAYCVYSKRAADAMIGIAAAITCLAGLAMPMLLPVVVLAILWHLHRRAMATTWLLT